MLRPVCIDAKAGGLLEFPIPLALFALPVAAVTLYIYLFWLRGGKPAVEAISPGNADSVTLPGECRLQPPATRTWLIRLRHLFSITYIRQLLARTGDIFQRRSELRWQWHHFWSRASTDL